MTDLDRGQVSTSAAEVYESFFVPALFGQWTVPVLDAADVAPGDRLLDVGCGSGVLARAALSRVGGRGAVVGLDPNEGMLAVARGAEPDVDWHLGRAEDLPFEGGSFDRVVSQFALMFFADQAAGVQEMARVARSRGRITVAVWASLARNPGYAALADLVERLFGSAAGAAIRTPFALGDHDELRQLVADAAPDPAVAHHDGTARFDSLHAWLHTEIRGWTLAEQIDDDGFDVLLRHAEHELRDLIDPQGGVTFPVTALIASAEVATE